MFRGLCKLDKKWKYGSLLVHNRSGRSLDYYIKMGNKSNFSVYPDTIGQYIGEKYFFGVKKIYEGDTVRYDSEYSDSSKIYTVIFDHGSFVLKELNADNEIHIPIEWNRLFRVGNIHESKI